MIEPVERGLAVICRLTHFRIAVISIVAWLCLAPARAQEPDDRPAAAADDKPHRQLTVMAIRARKGETATDPKLASVEAKLAQLLPNHGFTLWEGRSRRIGESESLELDSKNGMKLTIRLIHSEDQDGKVCMDVRLTTDSQVHLNSRIRTPSNQIFFLDHKIDDAEHLLIAVGAR